MSEKKTWILLALVIFGAVCFGGGVLCGQHALRATGFVYQENAADGESGAETEKAAVDLNTASAEELAAVPGIGAVTAEKIVASREAEGAFTSVADLTARGVVGQGKLSEIEAALTVK